MSTSFAKIVSDSLIGRMARGAPSATIRLVSGACRVLHSLRCSDNRPGSGWTRQRLIAAIFLTALVVFAGILLWEVVRSHRTPALQWMSYDPSALAHCRRDGRLAVVVYYFPWSTAETVWTFCPFDDPQVVKSVTDARAMTMATWPRSSDDSIAVRAIGAIQADLTALDVTQDDLPLIVIYDSRRGDLVIRPIRETRDERAHRVGELIRKCAAASGASGGLCPPNP
jgi:hypothetical protein